MLGTMTLHNDMIFSTLSINSRNFTFGFPNLHTNSDSVPYKSMINHLVSQCGISLLPIYHEISSGETINLLTHYLTYLPQALPPLARSIKQQVPDENCWVDYEISHQLRRGEQNIFYKSVETSHWNKHFKTMRLMTIRNRLKRTIFTSGA